MLKTAGSCQLCPPCSLRDKVYQKILMKLNLRNLDWETVRSLFLPETVAGGKREARFASKLFVESLGACNTLPSPFWEAVFVRKTFEEIARNSI